MTDPFIEMAHGGNARSDQSTLDVINNLIMVGIIDHWRHIICCLQYLLLVNFYFCMLLHACCQVTVFVWTVPGTYVPSCCSTR